MNDLIRKYRDNVDTTIVVSTITATVIIGLAVYGMRKAGLSSAARIVTAAK